MRIPKYVDEALKRRTKYANLLSSACEVVDGFIGKHGIDVEDCDWMTGCEIYVNPQASEMRIRTAIATHKGDGGQDDV